MEEYLRKRSALFDAGSEFSCPDSCERYGCKEPGLHVSINLVDLLAVSFISGEKVLSHFKEDCKMGFDPIDEGNPWLGRISIELKKPCIFLNGKDCSVYPGRPTACALFPEYDFMVGNREFLLKKGVFRNFPCIQHPCSISPQRRETLRSLMEMSIKEAFLSDFYLFGISPFVLDVKTIAGEGLEGVHVLEDGRTKMPHHRIERLVSNRLKEGGHLEEWEAKVERLDGADGLNRLLHMKGWTDQLVMSTDRIRFNIAYQFDGNRLRPIRPNYPCSFRSNVITVDQI